MAFNDKFLDEENYLFFFQRVFDAFAGVGGIRLGFEDNGFICLQSCEINKFSRQTYKTNFKDMPLGDIKKVLPKHIKEIDVLTAGFPCKAFSANGKQRGFSCEVGRLFFFIQNRCCIKDSAILSNWK